MRGSSGDNHARISDFSSFTPMLTWHEIGLKEFVLLLKEFVLLKE